MTKFLTRTGGFSITEENPDGTLNRTLQELINVSDSDAINGQALVWDSDNQKWAPGAVASSGGTTFFAGQSGYAISDGSGSVDAVSSNWSATVPGLTFTAPSSGKFQLVYEISSSQDGSDQYRKYGVKINGSDPLTEHVRYLNYLQENDISSGYSFQNFTGSFIVDLQVGDTVDFAITKGSGGSDTDFRIHNTENLSNNYGGMCYLNWNKISDFVPAIGFKAEYGSYEPVNRTTVGTISLTNREGNMPVAGASAILLKAGVTYELFADLEIRAGYGTYRWRIDNTTYIGNEGIKATVTSTQNVGTSSAYAIYTPSTDVYARLELTGLTSFSAIYVSRSTIYVKAIADQMPIYQNYQAEFGSSDLLTQPNTFIATGTEEKILEIDLPSAGTYKLTAQVRYRANRDNTFIQAWFADAAGTTNLDAGNRKWTLTFNNDSDNGQSDIQGTTTMVYLHTITAPETVSVVAHSGLDSADIWHDVNGETTLMYEKVASHLPITNAETLGGLNDVTTPSAPISGAQLRYLDGEWTSIGAEGTVASDTYPTITDSRIPFSIGWNTTNQQPRIKNTSGGTLFFGQGTCYERTGSADTPVTYTRGDSLAATGAVDYGNPGWNFGLTGDRIVGVIRVATSEANMSHGTMSEFEVEMTRGDGLTNHYYRIERIK